MHEIGVQNEDKKTLDAFESLYGMKMNPTHFSIMSSSIYMSFWLVYWPPPG